MQLHALPLSRPAQRGARSCPNGCTRARSGANRDEVIGGLGNRVQKELKSSKVGLLGELEVELMLVRQGWHPVRLDTGQMASNADLLAISREHRVCIQVKTTDSDKGHSHSQWLGFG